MLNQSNFQEYLNFYLKKNNQLNLLLNFDEFLFSTELKRQLYIDMLYSQVVGLSWFPEDLFLFKAEKHRIFILYLLILNCFLDQNATLYTFGYDININLNNEAIFDSSCVNFMYLCLKCKETCLHLLKQFKKLQRFLLNEQKKFAPQFLFAYLGALVYLVQKKITLLARIKQILIQLDVPRIEVVGNYIRKDVDELVFYKQRLEWLLSKRSRKAQQTLIRLKKNSLYVGILRTKGYCYVPCVLEQIAVAKAKLKIEKKIKLKNRVKNKV